MLNINLKESNYKSFLKRAKKQFPNEIFAFLVGKELPEGNFNIDKLIYLPDKNGTPHEFWISYSEFKKVLKNTQKKGLNILGYIHTHCYEDDDIEIEESIPSIADYEVANDIKTRYENAFKLIGVCALYKTRKNYKNFINFYPTREKVNITWLKNPSQQKK